MTAGPAPRTPFSSASRGPLTAPLPSMRAEFGAKIGAQGTIGPWFGAMFPNAGSGGDLGISRACAAFWDGRDGRDAVCRVSMTRAREGAEHGSFHQISILRVGGKHRPYRPYRPKMACNLLKTQRFCFGGTFWKSSLASSLSSLSSQVQGVGKQHIAQAER